MRRLVTVPKVRLRVEKRDTVPRRVNVGDGNCRRGARRHQRVGGRRGRAGGLVENLGAATRAPGLKPGPRWKPPGARAAGAAGAARGAAGALGEPNCALALTG